MCIIVLLTDTKVAFQILNEALDALFSNDLLSVGVRMQKLDAIETDAAREAGRLLRSAIRKRQMTH